MIKFLMTVFGVIAIILAIGAGVIVLKEGVTTSTDLLVLSFSAATFSLIFKTISDVKSNG